MNKEDMNRFSKLLPYQSSKIRSKSYIQDGDLQIQVASKEFVHTDNFVHADNNEAFQKLYAYYMNKQKKNFSHSSEAPQNVVKEVQHEMEEAKHTYHLMMDISHSISQAYQDLKKLQ